MRNKIKGLLMQGPMVILYVVSALAGYYAVYADMGIGWEVPITQSIFVILYFWGRKIEATVDKDVKEDIIKELD